MHCEWRRSSLVDPEPRPSPWRERFRLPILVVITVLCFSAIEVVANPIRERIDPLAMTFWRFLLGGLCLLPVWLVRRRGCLPRVAGRDWFVLAALGCLNVIVSMGAHAVCIRHARASTAAILIAANPLATNVFAWLLRGEPLTGRRWIALLIGLAGVSFVSLRPGEGLIRPSGLRPAWLPWPASACIPCCRRVRPAGMME
jgi:drug/metabolite transporter (DMT)-like permease